MVNWCQPQRIDAEPLKVVDLVKKAFELAFAVAV
jgi:hypothetical protein